MPSPIMVTKFYIPKPKQNNVIRHRLINVLNNSDYKKLTLICAPAGYGKTTLASEWLASCDMRAAWLSLEESEENVSHFITYIIYSLQSLQVNFGEGLLTIFHSPQLPPIHTILTMLINELATIPYPFILVLDDYHMVNCKQVNDAMFFLLEHLPAQMHIVITTREEPNMSLAKLRACNELNEIRTADLKFTLAESEEFLNGSMHLNLPIETVTNLELRTEGWIAGLQLAALSIKEDHTSNRFISSLTGSHQFVLDYLVEEVLHCQSENARNFLLQTSIVNRLCAPLCDAIIQHSIVSSQNILLELFHKSLFILPLDYEREWYRYHHLFADLLRKKLKEYYSIEEIESLHKRASIWYEENGLEVEAFQHAVKSHDDERAARLLEGKGMPLHLRGATSIALNWLESRSVEQLNEKPSLWIIYGSALLMAGKPTSVEQKLKAGEVALATFERDDNVRDLLGLIAATRATLASLTLHSNNEDKLQKLTVVEATMLSNNKEDITEQLVELIAPVATTDFKSQQDLEAIIKQSHLALDYLRQDNIPVRSAAAWMLGVACQRKGDYVAALDAYKNVIAYSKMINHQLMEIMAVIGLGQINELTNSLKSAKNYYEKALLLGNELPLPALLEAKQGLERISRLEQKLMLIEPLSQREIEVLQLIAIGLSNRDIADKLFLALDTVKGHNRKIFEKLQVKRRTEAIARAVELNLLEFK